MLRTVVSFDSADKTWLDHQAKKDAVSMTEVVRKAVRHYRTVIEEKKQPRMLQRLKKTAGIWTKGNALDYQKKLRKEWE